MRLFLGTRVLHEMPHNGVTKKNNQVADAIAAGHTLLRRERIYRSRCCITFCLLGAVEGMI
jgi:hypothetical protein